MNDRIATTLRRLDASPAKELDDIATRRSAARLQQILATPVPSSAARPARLPGRRIRRTAIGLTAAVAATAAIVTIAGPSGGDNAYASWTATPSPLTSADHAVAVQACRSVLQHDPGSQDLHASGIWSDVVADRRGDWISVALSNSAPAAEPGRAGDLLLGTCLVDLPAGTTTPVAVLDNGLSGSSPVNLDPAQIEQATIESTESKNHPAAVFSFAQVGADVRAVRITLPNGTKVDATVDNGQYVAWWPDAAAKGSARLRYQVTLADGTVEQNPIQKHLDDGR
jgi:hypothetical protein